MHRLTNNTVEKLFDLSNATVQVTAIADQPSLVTLYQLAQPVPGTADRPTRRWRFNYKSQSNATTSYQGTAIMSDIRSNDQGVGPVEVSWTLDFQSSSTNTAVLEVA